MHRSCLTIIHSCVIGNLPEHAPQGSLIFRPLTLLRRGSSSNVRVHRSSFDGPASNVRGLALNAQTLADDLRVRGCLRRCGEIWLHSHDIRRLWYVLLSALFNSIREYIPYLNRMIRESALLSLIPSQHSCAEQRITEASETRASDGFLLMPRALLTPTVRRRQLAISLHLAARELLCRCRSRQTHLFSHVS